MLITRIRKRVPPPGYKTFADTVHAIGTDLFGQTWLTKLFQEDLPYYLGKSDDSPTTPSLDFYDWELQNGTGVYKRIKREKRTIENCQVGHANELRLEYDQVTEKLRFLVASGKIAVTFQTRDGGHTTTPELVDILWAQWSWMVETGQIRVRREEHKDRMLAVFFEQKNLPRQKSYDTLQNKTSSNRPRWKRELLTEIMRELYPNGDPGTPSADLSKEATEYCTQLQRWPDKAKTKTDRTFSRTLVQKVFERRQDK